ncbi:MAG: Zinc-type alcohol dehydrogenase-like protein [Steroidobacteraceae bacterium]|nr:Zinc-type alcohol dehydrogenase-like protein [Steroidobacteraceae bacterium]
MKKRYKILGGLVATLVLAIVASLAYLGHDAPCASAPPPAADTPTMRAITFRCYGGPEVLRVETVARPALPDDGVLVRVHAAAANPLDWHYLRGTPYLVRIDAGIGAPKLPSLGVDFAGTVAAVGKDVTRFKPGEAVFGGRTGAYGEYVVVRESRAIAMKPGNVSFEQAASVPIAGVTALQALRDKGHLQPGQKVLINGASGGVGTFAVQIAKALGAHVTGVCSARNAELVRSLGADEVIDYAREDFTRRAGEYDLIVDMVSSRPLRATVGALKPGGTLVIVGSLDTGHFLGPLKRDLAALLLAPFVSQKLEPILASLDAEDLASLADLMRSGKLTPVIDRRFTLEQVPEAIRYLESGRARGKIVISIDEDVAPGR